MQFGPDAVPVSTQSVVIGPPLKAPAPVPVTTTTTIIEPLVYDPTPTLITAEGNVVVDIPYAVAVEDQGSEVTSKVTTLNFVGPVITNDQGYVTLNFNSLLNVVGGSGIGVATANGNTTITNTGVINVLSGSGIGVVTANGNATVTNTGVTSVAAGNSISVSAANGAVTVTNTFTETVYNAGNATGNVTPDRNNGTIQKYTLTGNITLFPVTNIAAGQWITLIFTQDGVGNRLLDANTAYLFASGFQTFTTDSGAIDMINVFYDGTNYYATLTVDYS